MLLRLPDALPVHLQWSPDGAQLAVLVQAGELLQLWVCALAGGAQGVMPVSAARPQNQVGKPAFHDQVHHHHQQ